MIAYWILFGLAAIGCVAINGRQTLRHDDSNESVLPVAVLLVVLLSVFAGTRSPLSDADYLNYLEWFNAAASTRDSMEALAKDPVFSFLGKSLRTPSGNLVFLMLTIALMSFIVKMRVLLSMEYAGLLGFGLLFLVARFFLLHEFTQVRASLGISLATLALVYSAEGHRLRAMVVFLLASLVHLSVVAMLPLWLVSDRWPLRVKSGIVIATGASLGVFGYFTGAYSTMLSEVAVRLLPYLSGEYETAENTLFSFYLIVKAAALIVLWGRWPDLNRGLRLATVASSYGVAMTVIFIQIDVLSLRLAELMAIFDCICFAYVFRYLHDRAPVLATAAAVALAGAFYIGSLGVVNDYEVIRW